VHDLGDDAPSGGVHRVRDGLPAGNLLGLDKTGLAGKSLACVAWVRSLTDEQAERSALGVMQGNKLTGHPGGTGANAGERCHDEPIGQLEATKI
jgi:hypothetical protein